MGTGTTPGITPVVGLTNGRTIIVFVGIDAISVYVAS